MIHSSPFQNSCKFSICFIIAFLLVIFLPCYKSQAQVKQQGWPPITHETKPWTRWWWQGNALTKEGITAEMEAYQKAGLGGVEITPIYGVLGYEGKFVDYLSPQWTELLLHTLKEGKRLDMGIDMATGTGWPFGGPAVSDEDACKNMNHKVYEIQGGQTLQEKIEFIQQPLFRFIGNSLGKPLAAGISDPAKFDIKQLLQPISANKNLQALALDQLKFERPLPLQVLMAYGDNGEIMNLTSQVDASGKLNWTAPAGTWKLYAVFAGWHGKMVERAGPGGEGNVIDHFSTLALKHYLSRFDNAFAGKDIQSLRAFFNDSYEVDDARGTADWTPMLFQEFKKRKGYDLKNYLPELYAKDDKEKNKRILCDYRETISELVLDNFTTPWRKWAHGKAAMVRNQAHGSPSNILDLYAVVDIPEIEGIEPLRIKMASSVGNVMGKKLVSSESATWLNEHFESNLADIKVALDRFMINGVNHLFYHGTCYSPPGEPWPGWLFYAAVHLNPRNSQWNDFDALNNYAARCQSFLQNSTADNDVLLYFPIYDRFSTPGNEMLEHFDGLGRQFANTAFEHGAEAMYKAGYAFDYISDKQIMDVKNQNGKLKTAGNSFYQTIVIPHSQFIPLKTFNKIISLAEKGATIIALEGLPSSIAGYANLQTNQKMFDGLINKLGKSTKKISGIEEMKIGKGRVLKGDSLDILLAYAAIRKEKMTGDGIQFIRKKESNNRTVYFIVNNNDKPYVGWLPLEVKATSITLYNPMNGEFGSARTRKNNAGLTEVYVNFTSKQSLILETNEPETKLPLYKYYSANGNPIPLDNKWRVSFSVGGPTLPATVEIDTLASWTAFGTQEYNAFSGTATYTYSFAKPSLTSKACMLDLGIVHESAEVFLNGKSLGTLIGPDYSLYFDQALFQDSNVLEVKVSNLMANRIADMDRKHIVWRKFYNVNFPARKPENRKNGLFDAAGWNPKESGLLGPVRLIPVNID